MSSPTGQGKKEITPRQQSAKRRATLYYRAVGLALLVLLALGLAVAGWRAKKIASQSNPPLTPATPSATPTVPTQIQPVETVTPTPVLPATPTPPPTASPSPTSQLPAGVQSLLKGFYAAYANKDREKLGALFTPDSTAELKDLHARLFKGVDENGNPLPGPLLFSSNSASQYASTYSLTGFSRQGSGWLVSIQEQRKSIDGAAATPQQTQLVILPSGSSWLVDSYVHKGTAGKYDGFLIQ